MIHEDIRKELMLYNDFLVQRKSFVSSFASRLQQKLADSEFGFPEDCFVFVDIDDDPLEGGSSDPLTVSGEDENGRAGFHVRFNFKVGRFLSNVCLAVTWSFEPSRAVIDIYDGTGTQVATVPNIQEIADEAVRNIAIATARHLQTSIRAFREGTGPAPIGFKELSKQ